MTARIVVISEDVAVVKLAAGIFHEEGGLIANAYGDHLDALAGRMSEALDDACGVEQVER